MMTPKKLIINKKTKKSIIVSLKVLGILLCAVLIFLIVANLTLIIKGVINTETPPSFIGIIPLSVVSDSMDTGEAQAIKSGDLILINVLHEGDIIEENEVIAFLADDNTVITHRVVGLGEDLQGNYYITKGDANNNVDMEINGEPAKVRYTSIIGIYSSKINNLGYISLAVQTPAGMILFLGIPVLLIIGYDLLRRRIIKNKQIATNQNTQVNKLTIGGEQSNIHVIENKGAKSDNSESELSDKVTENKDK